MYINREKQNFFNSHAKDWDETKHLAKMARIGKIFQEYEIRLSGNILDIGCGTGILVPTLLSYSEFPHHIFELDFSRDMMVENKKKHKENLRHLNFINGDALCLPFPEGSIQWIIGLGVLPHLGDTQGAIREWTRIISDGGKILVLHFMNSRDLNKYHSQIDGAVKFDHLLSINELVGHFQEQGWKVLRKREMKDLYLLIAQKQF
jgi:ubiquinone/menaquinone biosynthesis C-methylase UbiE